MRAHWTTLYHRLIETVCRVRSQLDLSHLDVQSSGRCQTRALLGLVHRARHTPFGRDHDFCRIRTPADYCRLVPLRTADESCHDSNPGAGPIRRASRTTVNPNGSSPGRRLSLAGPQRDAFRAAVRTGLALAASRKLPHRLYSGRLLLAPPSLPAWPDRPLLLHPWSLGEAGASRKLFRLAADTTAWKELLRHEPVTCLAGSVEGLLRLGQMVLEQGQDLSAVWPDLALVFCLQEDSSWPLDRLAPLLGERPRVLQTISCLDGVVALTDPRHGGLRLLTDHGLYFEFIPEEQRALPRPERRLSRVQCGVPHELVLTSPLGLWACRTDLVLTLARLDPPLLASVERKPLTAVPSPQQGEGRKTPPGALTNPQSSAGAPSAPVFHPRSADSPARPPEMFGQTLWSIPADRG